MKLIDKMSATVDSDSDSVPCTFYPTFDPRLRSPAASNNEPGADSRNNQIIPNL